MLRKIINYVYWKYYKNSVKTKLAFLKLKYSNRVSIAPDLLFRRRFKILVIGNGKLSIGTGCFFNNDCSINCMGEISISNNTIFGENVKFYDHNHRFSDHKVLIKNQGYKVGSIKVGENCWIGSNVTILKDVIIGDNVIIGANCLINKSIPSNTIVRLQSNLILEEKRIKMSNGDTNLH